MQSKLTQPIQDKIERLKRYGAEPDHELLLWERWAKIRKEEVIELGNKTMRPPADLAMNTVDDYREAVERDTVTEQAQIPKLVRLGYGYWVPPPRLASKCPYHNEYEIKRTRAQLGRPRIIERVGVPEYIRVEEKGIIGKSNRNPLVTQGVGFNEYRKKREEELKERMDKIDPVRPEMKELVVIGRKPKPPPTPMPPVPQLIYTDFTDTIYGPLTDVYALKINKTVIFKDVPGQSLAHLQKMQQESWHEPCYAWTYYFNVPLKRMGRAKLFLQNLGTVALRYCWKKIRHIIPFIPDDTSEQTFFFYKSEDVLSPGQSKEIPITFISGRPGNFSESWELSLSNVCLFNTLADKFVINLSGDSLENLKSINKKIEKLQARLDRKAISRIVVSLINDVFASATTVQHQIYPYKKRLLETEIFVMKNPVCYYHQTDVLALREKYEKEMMPGKKWDLSIATWRQAMFEKDYEDRMYCYEFLKKTHALLIRPWHEGDDLLLSKYRAVKMVLGQLADKFHDERLRLLTWNGVFQPQTPRHPAAGDQVEVKSPLVQNKLTGITVRNVFYVHMYEHVASAMETCAGLLSSFELNKMMEFDFCRY